MAVGFLAWELMVLRERVRMVERRLERKILRDTQNPFDLPQNEFMNIFRISPELAMDLTNLLRPDLRRQRTSGISPEIQVLVAVQFYAHGSYQLSTATTTAMSTISHDTRRTSSSTHKICQCTAANAFDGAIGAIDCTFINILGPSEHEEAYVNHHGNHSLNVQAIVDSDMKLLNINARWPGARNNAYIWSTSPIRRAMEYHYNQGERRTWLIGDAGYPLEPWLMTPLPNYPEGTRQFLYTQDLCRARNVVERFFGLFKSMWRCLSYQRVLMYAPAFAGHIVNVCAVLHNMRLHHRLPVVDFDDIEEIEVGNLERPDNEHNIGEIRQQGPRALAQRFQYQIMRERYPNAPFAEAADG